LPNTIYSRRANHKNAISPVNLVLKEEKEETKKKKKKKQSDKELEAGDPSRAHHELKLWK
jgi:hypothetical protein